MRTSCSVFLVVGFHFRFYDFLCLGLLHLRIPTFVAFHGVSLVWAAISIKHRAFLDEGNVLVSQRQDMAGTV
jgi:hypothetical protein